MIAALRRRHARVWAVLALLLPALLVLALRVRATRPSDALPALPPALLAAAGASIPADASRETGPSAAAGGAQGSTGAAAVLLWESRQPFDGLDIGARIDAVAGQALVLTLRPAAALLEPDVLLYFRATSGGAAAGDDGAAAPGRLSPADVLLGALSGALARSYALPAEARAGGELRLYSLAHDATLARATLPPLGAAPAPATPAVPAGTPPADRAPR